MTIKELKQEAADLGIQHHPNIGAEKLQAKIDEHYESKEANLAAELVGGADEEDAAEEAKEPANESKPKSGKPSKGKAVKAQPKTFASIAKDIEKRARKKSVVAVIDNDQRINDQATTCTANCSNEYFDLGTLVIPLNHRVELYQGHIDTLRSVNILQHVKDPRDPSISHEVLRPRYTIVTE